MTACIRRRWRLRLGERVRPAVPAQDQPEDEHARRDDRVAAENFQYTFPSIAAYLAAKSGTNRHQGTAFYFGRYGALLSENSDGTKDENFSQHQFGGSLGALLLSPDAEIDTKPELEIFADDVKCAHGATVGQLDEQAMFYLNSRGIGPETADAILLYALGRPVFVADAYTRRVLSRHRLVPADIGYEAHLRDEECAYRQPMQASRSRSTASPRARRRPWGCCCRCWSATPRRPPNV